MPVSAVVVLIYMPRCFVLTGQSLTCSSGQRRGCLFTTRPLFRDLSDDRLEAYFGLRRRGHRSVGP